jgi:hypothetical protein
MTEDDSGCGGREGGRFLSDSQGQMGGRKTFNQNIEAALEHNFVLKPV